MLGRWCRSQSDKPETRRAKSLATGLLEVPSAAKESGRYLCP
jgi:hypothetical protein